MRHIATAQPVLVVNSIGLRMPLPGRSSRALRRIMRKMASIAHYLKSPLAELPDFHVFSPLSLPLYGDGALARLNSALVALQVRLAFRRLGLIRPACLVTLPTAGPVIRHLNLSTVIFNRADKLSLFAEADKKVIAPLEEQLLREADVVIYASRTLMESERSIVGDRGRFVGHGVDLDHFTRRAGPEPGDISAIPHPRIGFFGTLDQLVDYGLLYRTATAVPSASLVLVGPVLVDVGRLEALPNVHVLGPRPYEDIPRYGSAFDVALMPWVQNEWIRWCSPVKLKEYLALGLPVVSTPFPELAWFRGLVRVGGTPDDFVAQVRATLAGEGRARAEEPASVTHFDTWDDVARKVLALAG